MIAENGNLWAFGIRPEPRFGAYSSPQIPLLLEMGLLPLQRTPPRQLFAFDLDFWHFRSHSAASPTVFIPLPMLKGLGKTLTLFFYIG